MRNAYRRSKGSSLDHHRQQHGSDDQRVPHKTHFQSRFSITELDKSITSVTVVLNTPAAISEMEFSGETTGYKTIGSFTVDEPNKGRYGIG